MLRGTVFSLGLLLVLAPASSLAQTPLAGSAGAGNAAISGIPPGPANNPTLSDPSGIGNASRAPTPPSQALIPSVPVSPGYGSTVVMPRAGSSAPRLRTLRRTAIHAPRSARPSRSHAVVTAQDKRLDGKFSICRGC